MKKITLAFFASLLFSCSALAAAGIQEIDNSAAISAKYLDFGSGAAAAGMANAYTGVAIDSAAIFWNPAGLANMQKNSKDWNVYFSQNMWLVGVMDSMVSDIAAAKHIKKIGVFGAGISYYNAGKIERAGIDSLGNPVPSDDTYSPYSLCVNAAYSSALEDGIDFGVNLKYLLDVIDGDAAHGVAFDVGVRYAFPFLKGLSLNITAKNFGGRLNESIMAREMDFGAAYSTVIEGFKLTAAYDASGRISNNPLHKAGIEVVTPFSFTVRAGYQTDNTTVDEGFRNFTFGAGFNISDKYVDFAFEPYGDIGNTLKLSLGGDF